MEDQSGPFAPGLAGGGCQGPPGAMCPAGPGQDGQMVAGLVVQEGPGLAPDGPGEIIITAPDGVTLAETVKDGPEGAGSGSANQIVFIHQPEQQAKSPIAPRGATASSPTLTRGEVPILPSTQGQPFPRSLLAAPSPATTTVEQPNAGPGPSLCFICGGALGGPGAGRSGARLLELLSTALSQRVVTDTPAVELCPSCCQLAQEAQAAHSHLNQLLSRLTALFTHNLRPKLTLQLLAPPGPGTNTNPTPGPAQLNLDDLAATRSRRGRRTRGTAGRPKEEENSRPSPAAPPAPASKRKGGRPRKPFGCHICKRKFHAREAVATHMVREHDTHPVGLARPLLGSEAGADLSGGRGGAQLPGVKQEQEETAPPTLRSSPAKVEATVGAGVAATEARPAPPPSPAPRPGRPSTAASQVLASLRPIQPKPRTVVQTAPDGSLVVLVAPALLEAPPALIKVSPGHPLARRPTRCSRCPKTFPDERTRTMHTLAAHPEGGVGGPFPCRACEGATFPSRRALADHRRTAHPRGAGRVASRPHGCRRCGQTFGYKYQLERHRDSHVPYTQAGPHEFLCRLCGLRVASRAALKIHLHRFHRQQDQEARDYLCAQCGHLAASRKAFSDHQRVHGTEAGPRVTCRLCGKEMRPSSHKVHMRRMHGEATYPCHTCGQRFTVRSDLMRHLNTVHSSVRPYDCDLCGEKFSTSDALRYHRNKTHSTVTHQCELCPKSYKWKGELRTHVQRVHNQQRERFQCSVCPRSYADRRKLRHHLAAKHGTTGSFIGCQTSEKPPTTEELPTTEYQPQGSLLTQPQPPQALPQDGPVVTIPVYHQHDLNPHQHVAPTNQHVGMTQAANESVPSHITSDIYIVPNLAVPVHEEQVSTT